MLSSIIVFTALGLCTFSTALRAADSTQKTTKISLNPRVCNAAKNCTAMLNGAISSCKSDTPQGAWCDIELHAGVFHMEQNHPRSFLQLDGVNRVRIHGAGSDKTTLQFAFTGVFWALSQTHHVTLEGFSIDMDRVPYTLGVVSGITQECTTLAVTQQHEGLYPIDTATQSKYSFLSRAQAVDGYTSSMEQYNLPDLYTLRDTIPITYNTSASTMTLHRRPFGARVGQELVVRHQVYALNAFSGAHVNFLKMFDVVMYAAGGMGFFCDFCRDLHLEQVATRRKRFADLGIVRAMSITADGIHFSNCLGGAVTVRNCTLEGQGDDGMNINTPFGRVDWISSDRKAVSLSGYGGKPGSGNRNFLNGAVGEFFSGKLMTFLGFSSGTVSAVTERTVNFTAAIPTSVQVYDLVVNSNAQVDSVVVEDSSFLNNRARGVLLKQPHGVIRNSRFEGQSMHAIISEVDGCFWMEGRPFINWTVVNNTITQPDTFGRPSTVIHVMGQVAVFDPATGKPTSQCKPIDIPGVFENVTIADNFISHGARLSTSSTHEGAISVYATKGVTVRDNVIISADRGASSDCHAARPDQQGVAKPNIGLYYCDDFSWAALTGTNVCRARGGGPQSYPCCLDLVNRTGLK